MHQKSVLEGSRGALGGSWGPRSKKSTFLMPLGAILAPSWGPLGAVLALGSPSWAVLGRLGVVLGRLKIDVKIDQKIDTFQDRFLTRCWWILGRKWRQVGTRIYQKSDHKLTSYQKCRTGLRYYKNYYFFNRNGVLEVQASIKNRSKIDQNMRSTWDGVLAPIFFRFSWILDAKLGRKIR